MIQCFRKNEWRDEDERVKIPLLGFVTQYQGSLSSDSRYQKQSRRIGVIGSGIESKNIPTEDAKASNEPRQSCQVPREANGQTRSHAKNNDKSFSYVQNTSNLTRDVINHIPRLTPQPRSRELTTRNFADNPKISSGNSEETRKMLCMLIHDTGGYLHQESTIGLLISRQRYFGKEGFFWGSDFCFWVRLLQPETQHPRPVQPASPLPHSLATKRPDENHKWRIELFLLDSCTSTDSEL